jgi:hypothetical protein
MAFLKHFFLNYKKKSFEPYSTQLMNDLTVGGLSTARDGSMANKQWRKTHGDDQSPCCWELHKPKRTAMCKILIKRLRKDSELRMCWLME